MSISFDGSRYQYVALSVGTLGAVGTDITASGADPPSFNYDLSIPAPWFRL